MFGLDILALPHKYRFNEDAIKSGNYIDDGSLLVYFKLMRGWFTGKETVMNFLWGKPIEWSSKDFVSFLLKLSREYDLEIENVNILWGAIEDDFEKSILDTENKILPEYEKEFLTYFKKEDEYNKKVEKGEIDRSDIHIWFKEVQKYNPKHFDGSYKWTLEQVENNPESDFSKLFSKLKTGGNINDDDIEKILIYASRIIPNVINIKKKEETEAFYSKEIMGYVLDYLSFSVIITESVQDKIREDISCYLDLFIENKLNRDREKREIQNIKIKYPDNILTFEAHQKLFSKHLTELESKYGNNFRIINKFEEEFPYDDRDLETDDIRNRYRNKDFLFVHCVLAFEKLGLIKVQGVSSNWDALDVKPLAYECQIEVLPPFFGEINPKLHFDIDKSRFYVQGKEIKLKKFGDEYHTLRVIFENSKELSKEWFFSEIREKIDVAFPDDKKYYNAIYQLGVKLAKKGIDDFFITTRQSVKINKKYLS